MENMFCGFFKPKFDKKCKSTIKFIKIRLDYKRKRSNARVYYLKSDIVEILKTGHEHDDIAYRKVEELLEVLQMLSSYDLIERFCDFILSHLSLMLKQRDQCPEECKEAISSMIYAAARVRGSFPELKYLRTLLTRRYGNSADSSVNQELVEKLVWRKPSREVRIQKLEEIAQESNIRWDSLSLQLKLFKQIEQKETSNVETGGDNLNMETKKGITYEQSEDDESVLSQSWRRDTLSKGNLSSSSSSSSSSPRRESVKKKKTKILPYGLISPPDTKPEPRNDEKAQEERKEKMKSIDQENSRLLGAQGRESLMSTSNTKASSTRENKRT